MIFRVCTRVGSVYSELQKGSPSVTPPAKGQTEEIKALGEGIKIDVIQMPKEENETKSSDELRRHLATNR